MAFLAALVPLLAGATATAAAGGTAAAAATTIATIATVVGTGVSALGTIAAGKQAKQEAIQASQFEAAQLKIKANEEMAAGQIRAGEFKRRTKLALSAAAARAGSQGFTSTGATDVLNASEIARYGTLQAQLAQYGGESRSVGLKDKAQATLISGLASGNAAKTGSQFAAAGTILGGVSSMFKNYG